MVVMRNIKLAIPVYALAAVLFALGCTASDQSTSSPSIETPTIAPSPTSKPIPATSTSEPTATVSPTATAAPTSTTVPTATTHPAGTLSPTPPPTPSAPAVATPTWSDDEDGDISLAFVEVFSSVGRFWPNRKYPPEEADAEFKVIDSVEALEELLNQGYVFTDAIESPDAVETDFERFFLIAAFHPWRPAMGHIIEFIDVVARPPLIDSGKLDWPTWILVHARQIGPLETGVVQRTWQLPSIL